MRFSFNRLTWPWPHLPHLDAASGAPLLDERGAVAGLESDDSGCSLGVLEKRLCGLHRVGDVPGFEIPARFFPVRARRPGRAARGGAQHNRLDLLSTLFVSARASMLVVRGPAAAERGHECLGLGRVYERLDDLASAESCFARAAAKRGRRG